MAQAGGKNPAGVDQAIAEVAKVLENQLLISHKRTKNKKYAKTVDVFKISDIILGVQLSIPEQSGTHNNRAGGRLGVIACQM